MVTDNDTPEWWEGYEYMTFVGESCGLTDDWRRIQIKLPNSRSDVKEINVYFQPDSDVSRAVYALMCALDELGMKEKTNGN